MNNHKWTPGPWVPYIDKQSSTFSVCIPAFYGGTPCIVNWNGFDSCDLPTEQQLANAHLIAAAPELYDILQRCKDMGLLTVGYDSGPDHKKLCAHAETVMGKARGEEK